MLAVSPAPHADKLSAAIREDWYDHAGGGLFVNTLEGAIRLMRVDASGDAERAAFHRALLTVVIGAMERVDDSMDELVEFFREHERSYLDLIRGSAGDRGVMRDLLELAIWEDYGLFVGIEGFLAALPELHADVAVRELASIIAELRRERLTYRLRNALALRRVLLAAVDDAHDEIDPAR
jgi:hypothetical protein